MRKIYATILLTIGFYAMAQAAPVTKTAAQKTAARFFGTTTSRKAPRMVSSARRTASAQAAYYVFNSSDKNAFVIVSGDDRTPEIIGYSKAETFETGSLPTNIKAYLDGVKAQIDYLDRTEQETKQAPARVAATHSVQPLLSSTWNQSSPYSDQCPTVSNEQCATGCVATAMAQVMNYYHYPEATLAEIPTYTTSSRKITLASVPAQTTIDWANMLDNYTSTSTTEQQTAVANLMSYVGRSVKMDYNTAAYGGSGAYNNNIAPALRNYFGYPNAYDLDRSSTTMADFQQKVYNDIAASHPVILCGSSSGGGHCFVADGYDGDNYFHINWGWGGMCDGYFLLSLLNPDSNAGIGASSTTDGYTMFNSAVLGIAPEGQTVNKAAQGLTFSILEAYQNEITFAAFNTTGETHSFDYGLGYVDDSGLLTVITQKNIGSLNNNTGYNSLTLTLDGLKDGTYKVYLISRVQDTDEWVYNRNKMIKVTVSNGQYTSEQVTYYGQLSATSFNLPATLLSGQSVSANVAVTNSSDVEFYGTLYLFYTPKSTTSTADSSTPTKIANVGATLAAGKTTTVTIPFTLPAAGSYTLGLYDDENRTRLIGSQDITVTDATTSFDASKISAVISVNNVVSETVYGHNLTGSITFTNSASSDFSGTVDAGLAPVQSSYITSLKPFTVTIKAGESVTLPFSFDNQTTGTLYRVYALLPLNNQWNFCSYSSAITLSKGIECSKADGTTVNMAPVSSYTADTNDLAVDLTEADATVATVTPNDNPNTLYLFYSETDAAKALKEAGKNVVINGQADNITLTDGHGFCSPATFTAKTITYTRVPETGITAEKDGWETLALPFDATSVSVDGKAIDWFRSSSDKGKDFWLMYFSEAEGSTVVYDYVGDSIAANIPYLLAVPDDKWGKQYSLVGKSLVFSATDATVYETTSNGCISGSPTLSYRGMMRDESVANAYILTADGSAFEKVSSQTIPAFHACFTEKEQSLGTILTIAKKGGTTTTIRTFTLPKAKAELYNLQGQRVDRKYKGIVIVNGKKTMMK